MSRSAFGKVDWNTSNQNFSVSYGVLDYTDSNIPYSSFALPTVCPIAKISSRTPTVIIIAISNQNLIGDIVDLIASQLLSILKKVQYLQEAKDQWNLSAIG